MDREHLDWEDDIVEKRVLRKSCSHNGVGCPEHLTCCKKDPMSPLTPSPEFVDRGQLDLKVCTLVLGILSIHLAVWKAPFFPNQNIYQTPNSGQDLNKEEES